MTVPLLVMATVTAAAANNVDRIKVYDHTKRVYETVPATRNVCSDVRTPIYQDVQVQGDAASGALLGMIIGGLAGKGVTGKDDGAAAGAIMGGLIGADKGSKPKIERRIVGYETATRCDNITEYRDVQKEVYSHSTIRFFLNGKRYVLEFVK